LIVPFVVAIVDPFVADEPGDISVPTIVNGTHTLRRINYDAQLVQWLRSVEGQVG
jgi:hypothetical protein